jgi:butyryl-CoA dehydrogenase
MSGGKDEFAKQFDKLARTSPEKAANQILAAVEKDKRRALIGPDAKLLDLMSRLPAAALQVPLVKGARRRST